MGKHRHERDTQDIAPPPLTPTPFWRVVLLPTLAAMALVASVWAYMRPLEKPPNEDDRIVDAFRAARNADPKATLNLAPEPVFDDQPVSEAEADAMYAGYILHRVTRILDVRRGERSAGGAWLNTPHRFTLTTRVGVATPKVAVRVGGRVGAPGNLLITNPDIVVEVRDGKIHAIQADIHRD